MDLIVFHWSVQEPNAHTICILAKIALGSKRVLTLRHSLSARDSELETGFDCREAGTGPEAGPETGPEAGPETGPEAGPETEPKAGPEGGSKGKPEGGAAGGTGGLVLLLTADSASQDKKSVSNTALLDKSLSSTAFSDSSVSAAFSVPSSSPSSSSGDRSAWEGDIK